jgi:hypothetical protein
MRRYDLPTDSGDYRPARLAALMGFTALGIVLAGAALVGLVSWWAGASGPARGILVVLTLAALVPAVGLAGFSWHELGERGERHRWYRVTVERLELALDRDLDGDGQVGRPSLPDTVVLNAQGARVVQESADLREDLALERLLHLVEHAGRVGISRRQLLPRLGGDREFYDWSMHVLESLGLVSGRGDRVAGELTHDVETTKAAVLSAWGVGAVPGNGNGKDGKHTL